MLVVVLRWALYRPPAAARADDTRSAQNAHRLSARWAANAMHPLVMAPAGGPIHAAAAHRWRGSSSCTRTSSSRTVYPGTSTTPYLEYTYNTEVALTRTVENTMVH